MLIQPKAFAAPSKPQPTPVAMNPQDPAILPAETVTISITRSDKPSTKDYQVTDKVKADAKGGYVLEARTDPTGYASMNVLANLQTGLDSFLPYCDQDKIPATWWDGGPQKLDIYAFDRQNEANAFFNPFVFDDHGKRVGPGVHFGVFSDPQTKEKIYAAHSGEVTGHEGGPGHATLHRFRPNYIRSMDPEVRAYHEAFGDVSSILTQLKNPRVLDLVARQTGGDLSKHNAVSDLGEQFGVAINHLIESKGGPKQMTGGDYVRTAINDLRWQDPNTLPPRPDPKNPEQLTREPHDFSRVWTGAIYSILSRAVAQRISQGADAKTAIAGANEDLLKIYGKLTSNTSPEGDFSYADMAGAMLQADQMVGTRLGGIIQDEMTRRRILPAQSNLSLRSIPQGSYDLDIRFSGKEADFAGTPLESLGSFSMQAPQSGRGLGFGQDDHSHVRQKLARNLGQLARHGQILFTPPGQKAESPFDKNGQPYVAQVTWENGQARLEPVMVLS
ncbi:hypothetical protein JST97_25360 [bacterium]|nr:hypothetical protein [bacterium]